MSFDVYLQAFHRGEAAGISRELVRDTFGGHVSEVEREFWQLHYDETNNSDVYLGGDPADPSKIHAITINRPCSDERLWNALASLLRAGDIVLYFPGGRAPLIGRDSVTEHLPSDLVESLGTPVVVANGRDIQDEIRAA